MIKKIGNIMRIALWRSVKESGMPIEYIEDRAGFSKGYLSRIKNGIVNPSNDAIDRVLYVAGIRYAEFLGVAVEVAKECGE